MISNSLEWIKYKNILVSTSKKKINNLKNLEQVLLMINNIDSINSKLSIAEVHARAGQNRNSIELLAIVNNDISAIEDYIIMASLIG